MICCICESTDKWENVDKYRLVPKGMAICNGCGFVSYPTLYKTDKDIIEFYRKEYRNRPNVGNFFTCKRKLVYHNAFLKDLFKEWKESGKVAPVIGEIGAAYGEFLNWCRTNFPKSKLHGTELTLSMKRLAWQEFQIDLDDQLPNQQKYDMIASYKVAEHQCDIHVRLKEYREMLKDDGYLYISVPTWFNELSNFGLGGFDIEYYYEPSHINVWSKKLFEALLAKSGFKIIKYDGEMYNDTYLCQKTDPVDIKDKYENPGEVKKWLEKIFQAAQFQQEGKYKEALDAWPFFPVCYPAYYEMNRASLHKGGHEVTYQMVHDEFVKPMMVNCPNCVEVYQFAADIAMRYNAFKSAIGFLETSLQKRPGQAKILIALSHIYRQMALKEPNVENKEILFSRARDLCRMVTQVDLQSTPEAISWIFSDGSEILCPFEKRLLTQGGNNGIKES